MKKVFQSALLIMSMLLMVVSVSSCDDDDDDNKKGNGGNILAGRTFYLLKGNEVMHIAANLATEEIKDNESAMEINVVEFANDGTYTQYFAECYFDNTQLKYFYEQGEEKGSYEVKGHDLIVSYKGYNENEEEIIETETLHIKEDGKQVIIWSSDVEAISSSKDAYELLKEFKAKHSHAN